MVEEIRLPKPMVEGKISVEEALMRRRSVRSYKKSGLSLEQVSQLLWAAQGVNQYRRTAPSAGATYPLEVYLVVGEVEGLEAGIYHYSFSKHGLTKLKSGDFRVRLAQVALGQNMIQRAPIDIVIAADYERTTGTYGDRGIRYVHMEAGHVGQNIHLQVEALNLGTVMVGAFNDSAIKNVLGLRENPLYIIPIGKVE